MSKRNYSLQLKDHVSAKVPTISKAFSKYFGFGLDKVKKAVQGDSKAMEELGELGRQGRLIQVIAPRVAKSAIDAMKGTSAYNKALSDVAATGAKEGLAVDKSVSSAVVSELRYGHEILELATDLANKKTAEDLRHQYQINYLLVVGEVDKHLMGVDEQTRINQVTNKPDLKQLEIHESQQLMYAEHVLDNGELSRLDLLPFKSYTMQAEKKKGLLQGFLSIFGGR